jgi:pSer/pThr/pTyr-binding forkhead associated (FHA) protein
MDTAFFLFALRIISTLLIAGFIGTLAWLIWRDFRQSAAIYGSSRQSYGQIITLIELDGKLVKTGTSYPLIPLTSFGRAPTNTIQVEDSATSNEHAAIARRGEQWWLEDRHSRNGTTLNGTPIDKAVIVTHGDIIGIGKLRFRIEFTD